MSDRKQLEADLLHFVQARGERHRKVTPATDLLEEGLLDSLLLMDLIFHVEEQFDVRFDGDDVNPDNFRSIGAIVDLVMPQTSAHRRQAG